MDSKNNGASGKKGLPKKAKPKNPPKSFRRRAAAVLVVLLLLFLLFAARLAQLQFF